MAMRLDHTIVSAKDKVASAEFFAEMFGLKFEGLKGRFAPVRINEFADSRLRRSAPRDGTPSLRLPYQRRGVRHHPREDPRQGLPYGSGPRDHENGQINTRRGGRGFYFQDPGGHLLEVMTVPETGSQPRDRAALT